MTKYKIFLSVLILSTCTKAQEVDLNKLYQSWDVNNTFEITKLNAQKGKELWTKELIPNKSCASCHGIDIKMEGSHVKTNKIIKPLSPSANSKRLTKERKINKWLKRNCKFTYKRPCTTEEKINFIEFIKNN